MRFYNVLWCLFKRIRRSIFAMSRKYDKNCFLEKKHVLYFCTKLCSDLFCFIILVELCYFTKIVQFQQDVSFIHLIDWIMNHRFSVHILQKRA